MCQKKVSDYGKALGQGKEAVSLKCRVVNIIKNTDTFSLSGLNKFCSTSTDQCSGRFHVMIQGGVAAYIFGKIQPTLNYFDFLI